ncbi:ppGpp synthetase catalytic domain-containing protein (RelA/SpoT-type nucleotidyltranferase) [Peptoniphilus asaccharolyticus DSM 20463]|uniref:PpGpp synthetase catalytic domain-containing protein (RelA/SpoT-type nucleotidyltranferase) n=1 Tax=Peptoniphilus asaccharolyticus DSM 20463 TaxID=573058 RepID=A0A1W1UQD4_PEPAS|nr:(p)ppGpp synthetase [Peptoniphilus asaccharolyticus]MBL7575024.1 (p)ppGpp synthetase [Peptoniphilus asaccharolyticus]SMB83276.1 ppGpp synthetase catalytic domain-containing protein (RelA/SpoT-type nucleotidyltranferase) [Peptoniphilus asaccharolyticus DSM 20463]
MKLQLFDYIDKSAELLNYYRNILEEISENIVDYLWDSLDNNLVTNITYRTKSESSLREKIVKNNYFLHTEDPEQMLMNISDLIGVRIECRFLKEEATLFENILDIFKYDLGNGYYKVDENSCICLKLSDKQPQIQKNGFEIYKIDGIYEYGKNKFNFELQIKSMVNVFWGEIDHRILYKNYNYMMSENFIKEMMASIKDSLYMVDKQLRILFDHVQRFDASAVSSASNQLNYLLSKIIHDVFSSKIQDELGFVFNFKKTTDIIVEYLQAKASKERELSYGESFVQLIDKINNISTLDMNLQDQIVFTRPLNFSDDFTYKIGSEIERIIQKDFYWNLLIKIIHRIEGGKYEENLEDFLSYLRYKYSVLFLNISESFDLTYEQSINLEQVILEIIVENFKDGYSAYGIVKESFEKLEEEFKLLKSVDKVSYDLILEDFKNKIMYS